MKTNAKRILSLAVAAILLLGSLICAVSCGDVLPDAAGTTDGITHETDTNAPYSELDKENYNREFTVMIREDCADDFKVDGLVGNVLSDAIYERNVVVAEDFGVTFVYDSVGHDYNNINQKVQSQVAGGLDEYDVFIGHKSSYNSLAVSNYLTDLGQIDSIDLTGAWWDQGCYKNLTVDGKTYVMTGDILPDSSMRISSCFVFNKDLMTQLGMSVDDLNNTAADGGWTLDVLYQYGKDVTFDLNGDGKIYYEDDRYNLTGWMMAAPYALCYGTGIKFVEVVDGTPELTYTDERVTDIYEKIYAVVVEQQAYHVVDQSRYDTMFQVFTEGRALFSCLTLRLISSHVVDDMKDDFGILPVPKYDTHQKEYQSFVNGSTSLVMVAQTERDAEFVGAIMEAMATYNYSYVTPNMFQVVTKLQVAQDPMSAQMVDLVIRNRVFDLGYFADFNVTNLVKDNLVSKRAVISAPLKSGRTQANKKLADLLEAFSKRS